METVLLKEALFAGTTANAFKLGTVLTLGWFWPRVSGCSVLYRGDSMETIDFANVLTVAEVGADQIQPPSYLRHDSNSTYFYVIRRANGCGEVERTLSAAVKVSLDTDGELAKRQPNGIFEAKATLIAGRKVQIVWSYCPIGQKSKPLSFKVYCDGGTGQIDYETPLATIDYAGRGYYSYQTNTFEVGRYLFAVKVEDAAGTEDSCLAQIGIQVRGVGPDSVNILSAEIV